LTFLDLLMPDIDSIAAYRRLRIPGSGAPAYIVTDFREEFGATAANSKQRAAFELVDRRSHRAAFNYTRSAPMKSMIIPSTDEVLFETTLEPEKQETELTKGADDSEAILELFSGRKNTVAVGLPYYENITSMVRVEQNISPELEELINTHDFHFVSLSCSFLPDKDCNFTWARFAVELQAMPASESPIAWDLFPTEISTQIKESSSITVSPHLSFSLNSLKADATLFTVSNQRERFVYEPQIFSFGFRRSNVAWDFRGTTGKPIFGDRRNLLIIAMTPHESQLKGRFRLSAQVELDRLPFKLLLTKRANEIINQSYNLSA
jgi:hypothetical protein